MVNAAQSGAHKGSDFPFPEEYTGPYLARRRECGFQLYKAVGVERGDKEGGNRQALENFRLFDHDRYRARSIYSWRDGVLDLAGIELGATPDGFFAGRIDDRFIAPPVASNPFAIDVSQLANQAWIFKHVHGRCPLYLPGRGEFAAQDVVRVYGSHFRASRSATFSLQGGEWTVFFFFAGGLPRFFSVRLPGPEQAGKTATPDGFGKGYRSAD